MISNFINLEGLSTPFINLDLVQYVKCDKNKTRMELMTASGNSIVINDNECIELIVRKLEQMSNNMLDKATGIFDKLMAIADAFIDNSSPKNDQEVVDFYQIDSAFQLQSYVWEAKFLASKAAALKKWASDTQTFMDMIEDLKDPEAQKNMENLISEYRSKFTYNFL